MAEKFEDLTQKELLAVAEMFGTEVKPNASKVSIVKELDLDGVTFSAYQDLVAAVADEEPELALLDETPLEADLVLVPTTPTPVVAQEQEYTLVKMTRNNLTYETSGYKFTKEHPYVLVKEEVADYLTERLDGFRPATGKEIREFYGRN